MKKMYKYIKSALVTAVVVLGLTSVSLAKSYDFYTPDRGYVGSAMDNGIGGYDFYTPDRGYVGSVI